MSAILLRPSDLRSRRSWKASTSSSLIRRWRLPGKSPDGMSPRSSSLATKGRDSPSSSAASVGVSVTSAGIAITARPAARLFAALTTSRRSDEGSLISVPSAVRSTSSPSPRSSRARRLSRASWSAGTGSMRVAWPRTPSRGIFLLRLNCNKCNSVHGLGATRADGGMTDPLLAGAVSLGIPCRPARRSDPEADALAER